MRYCGESEAIYSLGLPSHFCVIIVGLLGSVDTFGGHEVGQGTVGAALTNIYHAILQKRGNLKIYIDRK